MPAQIVVADLEASLDFYIDVLGLGLVARTAKDLADELKQAEAEAEAEREGKARRWQPTRGELLQLDRRIVGGPEGSALQSATLRHSDGSWVRLLQLGSAYDARGARQASSQAMANSAERRSTNTGTALEAGAGAADLAVAAFAAAETARELALAAVVACEAVLETATEAGAESEGSPAAMATITFAHAAQQAAALSAEAATAAEVGALSASNAAAVSSVSSAETRTLQSLGAEAALPGGVALSFYVSEPELDQLVERLMELELPCEVTEAEEEEEVLGCVVLEDLDGTAVQVVALPLSRL